MNPMRLEALIIVRYLCAEVFCLSALNILH
jgi:hypothetical protein